MRVRISGPLAASILLLLAFVSGHATHNESADAVAQRFARENAAVRVWFGPVRRTIALWQGSRVRVVVLARSSYGRAAYVLVVEGDEQDGLLYVSLRDYDGRWEIHSAYMCQMFRCAGVPTAPR